MRVLRRRSGRLTAAVLMAVAIAGVSLVSIPAASAAGETQTLGDAANTAAPTCLIASDVVQLSSSGNAYVVPGDGWLTEWSTASSSQDATVRFEVWRLVSGTTYELVYISPDDVTVPGNSGTATFPLSPPVAVEGGDVLGLAVTSANGFSCLKGGASSADHYGWHDDTDPSRGVGDELTFTDGGGGYTVNVAAEFVSSYLNVVKLVSGSPTPGTVFTEHVECESLNTVNAVSPDTDVDVDLYFDEHGQPTLGTDPVIPLVGPTECTVTETVTGGAISVFYECHHFYPGEASGTEQSGCPGPHRGPSESPSYSGTVTFEGGDVGTITVMNGFVHFPPDGGPNGTPNTIPRPQTFPGTEPLTPLTPSQQPATPAAAVTAAPHFTG